MVMMHNLHEAPLLYLLQRRLKDGKIYTWAGDVLLALNPYHRIPELYQVGSFLPPPPPSEEGTPSTPMGGGTARRGSLAPMGGGTARRGSLTPMGSGARRGSLVAKGENGGALVAGGAPAAGGAPREVSPHVYAIARRAYTSLVEMMALSTEEAASEREEHGMHVDQSVLISGESGAGKTEASKHVLEYLTAASRSAKQAQGGGGGGGGGPLAALDTNATAWDAPGGGKAAGSIPVEALLREASPILESFGNAKTIRNDNSSRFGKYVAVQYAPSGGIVGAATETYLLERSRVVDISSGERNYHIFYQLLTDGPTVSAWGLPEASALPYLAADGVVATVEGANDAKDFLAVRRALETFGFAAEEQQAVLRILAAILLLGGVRFAVQGAGGGGGGGDGSGRPSDSQLTGDEEVAEIADEAALAAAAAALGCKAEALRFPMTCKNMTVMSETIVQRFTLRAAEVARDALAKSIFAALFDLIVERINAVSISSQPDARSIGILDIFGFEQLKVNSFEQLCINYVNEMLQEQFNEMVFASENRLLAAEGITVDDGALQSSATRLALMSRLLSGLDDQCRLGERGSDAEFIQEIGQQHTVRGMCQLETLGKFSINHYAGKVTYTAEGFVLKNTDVMHADSQTLMRACTALTPIAHVLFLGDAPDSARDAAASVSSVASDLPPPPPPQPPPLPTKSSSGNLFGKPTLTKRGGSTPKFGLNLTSLLGKSSSSLVKGAAPPAPATAGAGGSAERVDARGGGGGKRKGKKGGALTLGARLRAGIGEVGAKGSAAPGLMGRLRQTSVHYIRCVKPNDSMAAFGFEQRRVLLQLQYSGVLEMVRIRRQGFPSRMLYRDFEQRFAPLLFDMRNAASAGGASSKGLLGTFQRTFHLGDLDEQGQADAAADAALKAGRGPTLTIVERANLFEHRHYAFGKTMVFLRNGVEAALVAAVQRQMLALTWFQKTARQRVAARKYRAARAAVITIQSGARRRTAVRATRAVLAHRRRRIASLVLVVHACKIAKTVSRRAPSWLARTAAVKIHCQRLARGYLGRKHAKWLRVLASRAQPLIKLRWAMRVHVLAFRWAHALADAAEASRAARVARERVHTASATRVQANWRGSAPRRRLAAYRCAATRLQRRHRAVAGASTAELRFADEVNAAFRAAFTDDADGLEATLAARPALALVRQNRAGQRAGLAHAAAAGGAVRLAPRLFGQMYAAAIRAGCAAPPALPADPTAEQRADAELHAAVEYCCVTLKDAIGRTPLHYAARWGQLAFARWATRLLMQRAASEPEAATFFGVGVGGPGGAKADEAIDTEVRRAVLPVVLPGQGSRQRCLLILGELSLRLYALPPRAGASLDTAALDVGSLGKPLLSLSVDKLLYRRSEDRTKRDCIEVVIIKARKGKLQQMAKFESSAAEDVLEVFAGSPAEARHWMAALNSPRYLLSRGMHLVSTVNGASAAPRQTDLWTKWVLLNAPDARGEGMLAAALRGVSADEAVERARLVAWLLDGGAELLPLHSADPSEAARLLRRQASGGHMAAAASITEAGGPLALLLQLACGIGSGSGRGSPSADGVWASLLTLLVSRGAARSEAAQRGAALHPLLVALRETYAEAAAAAVPSTLQALDAAIAASTAAPAAADARRSGPPLMQPLPSPAVSSQNRSLVLLELSRVDVAAELQASPQAYAAIVSMVHEPASGGGGGGRPAGPSIGGVGAARARFQQFERQSGTAGAVGPPRSREAASSSVSGRTREASDAVPLGGGIGRRSRLVALVSEQRSCAPLAGSVSALWFQSTWSAPYLHGEEGALLLIRLVRMPPSGGEAEEIVGWAALPTEALGEQHVQLHSPPLPLSASEARSPRSAAIDAWIHCEVSLGVTGSYSRFTAANPALRVVSDPTSTALAQTLQRAERAASTASTGAGHNLRRQKSTFEPSYSRVEDEPTVGGEVAELLGGLPAAPRTYNDLLSSQPASSTPHEPAARRAHLQKILEAAAAAAVAGESELALQGYAAAFAISHSSPLLLLAANMLLRLGELDAAAAIYQRLFDEPGLSAEQTAMLPAKLEAIHAARERVQSGVPPSARPKVQRRASVQHRLVDRAVMAQFGSPADGSPSVADDEVPQTPIPDGQFITMRRGIRHRGTVSEDI